jgi:RNA polymerase sigma-70 factor (ECF subfamily)
VLEAVFSAHVTAVRAYIRSIVRDDHAADEVTQQVFLKALLALPGYNPDGPAVMHWLMTIARNTALTYRRDHARTDAVSDDVLYAEHERISARGGSNGPAWGSSAAVHDALATLSEPQREVLVLRHLGGLSTRQIGTIVNRAEGDVRQLEHRAITALRARLGVEA